MPGLHILINSLSEILLKHTDFSEPSPWLSAEILKVGQEVGEEGCGVVFAIAHQKREINEVVRVCEILQVREEHWEVGCCVAEGGAEEDSFFALPAAGCAAYVVEVVVADCFYVEFFAGGKEVGC